MSKDKADEPKLETEPKPQPQPQPQPEPQLPENVNDTQSTTHENRQKWNSSTEFLMSCIATSVGLGNVWRFPFVAYQNGGGAFLIPYVLVLGFIGMPMYYLETALGQFSSSNNVKIWACCPALKGTGYAQALGATYVLTYYVSIIALCFSYLIDSFRSPLPWSTCAADWLNCVPSGVVGNRTNTTTHYKSSAELYFVHSVLRRKDGIDDGIGAPIAYLTGFLLLSWLIIFGIVSCGVKSSGKASYFLALFPYVILIILFIRSLTLTGAADGIIFFFKPDWRRVIQLKVWYAAVTQVFFSLSVCSGALIMFSSYNGFTQNVYRDSIIVSILDTMTSILSGVTIFAILGNLAYELGYDDVQDVIGTGGTSLAFISYPDAIAKSQIYWLNHIFAFLFFLMMAVLGVGSGVALLSTVNTVLLDNLPRVKIIYMSAITCTLGFLIGLVYVTPGGQYILELVDYYGGTFLRLFAAICETIGIFWIYGLENLCIDIRFMLKKRPSCFWRVCWCMITPAVMIVVFIYGVVSTSALKFGATKYSYPTAAYAAGGMLQYTGMALIPIFIGLALVKNKAPTMKERVKKAFSKLPTFGPAEAPVRAQWRWYSTEIKRMHDAEATTRKARCVKTLFSRYNTPLYDTLRSGSPEGQSQPPR